MHDDGDLWSPDGSVNQTINLRNTNRNDSRSSIHSNDDDNNNNNSNNNNDVLDDNNNTSSRSGRALRCCCTALEKLFLLAVILLACGVILLPSAVYFIPRSIILNSSLVQQRDNTPLSTTLPPSNEPRNCSRGFYFDMSHTNTCRPSCEDFDLEPSIRGVSLYHIVVMVVGGCSCLFGGVGLVVVMLVKRRKM